MIKCIISFGERYKEEIKFTHSDPDGGDSCCISSANLTINIQHLYRRGDGNPSPCYVNMADSIIDNVDDDESIAGSVVDDEDVEEEADASRCRCFLRFLRVLPFDFFFLLPFLFAPRSLSPASTSFSAIDTGTTAFLSGSNPDTDCNDCGTGGDVVVLVVVDVVVLEVVVVSVRGKGEDGSFSPSFEAATVNYESNETS